MAFGRQPICHEDDIPGWLAPFPARSRQHFPRCQHPTDDGRIQLVLALADVARIVLHSEDEDRQGAFLVEGLLGDGYRQDSVQPVLAVGGFVAVLADVPGEDPDLVVVVR